MRKKPMLAYPVSAKPIDYSKPTFIQPKLDGVRCVIQYNWYECDITKKWMGEVKAYSRTGKPWKNIEHILEQLKPFFMKYPNVVLDGELYNHDLRDNFEKIISLVRKTKPTDEDRLEAYKYTQFHCYDIIDEKLPFDQRIEFVNQSLMLLGDSIYIVDTRDVFDEKMAKAFHKVNLKDGYEVYILVDVMGDATNMAHNTAIDRMVQAGAIPFTWEGAGAEMLRSYTNPKTMQDDKIEGGFVGIMKEHFYPFAGKY